VRISNNTPTGGTNNSLATSLTSLRLTLPSLGFAMIAETNNADALEKYNQNQTGQLM